MNVIQVFKKSTIFKNIVNLKDYIKSKWMDLKFNIIIQFLKHPRKRHLSFKNKNKGKHSNYIIV